MTEYFEFGWRVAVIAGICIFSWSIASSLERIARALGKIAEGAGEKLEDP